MQQGNIMISSHMSRIFNYRPEPDEYLARYIKISNNSMTKMLKNVDLRWMMSPVRNQDGIGACVSFALVANFEAIGNKTGIKHNLSELFLYYTARVYGEAYISSAVSELEMIGVCNENVWPLNNTNINKEPSQAAFNNASEQKIMKAFHVGATNEDLKAVLNAGYPVIISFPVYESFFETGKNGIVPLPKRGEKLIGGHAVLAVGYNENIIICKNSWGTQFGDNGYFYLPYEHEQFHDRWAILSIIGNTLYDDTTFNKYLADQGLNVDNGMHASTARNMGFFPPEVRVKNLPMQAAGPSNTTEELLHVIKNLIQQHMNTNVNNGT